MPRESRAAHPALPALAGLGLLCAFNAVFTPGFFAMELRDGALFGACIDVLKRGAQPMVLAAAATLVIATRGVDLAVGAVMALSGSAAAVCAQRGTSPYGCVAAALACSVAAGAFNGVLIAALRLPAIIATLVFMVAGRGIAQLLTDGQIVTFEDPALVFLGNGRIAGFPVPALVAVAVVAATACAARRTALGLFVRATGDNPEAARAAGVRLAPLTIGLYAFSGFCAGIAGILAAADIKAADANHAGLNLELDAVLAVVLGGTALTGGRFTLAGSAIGALLIQATTTTLYMHEVRPDVASAPKALMVLAVCALQSPTVRALRRRRAA